MPLRHLQRKTQTIEGVMAELSKYPKPKATPEVAESNWTAAPCGVTRDSDPLTCANFDELCNRLDAVDPYGHDWEVLQFDHWKVGWLENIFVRPGSTCESICAQTRAELGEYPCLNEDLWVDYEAERAK